MSRLSDRLAEAKRELEISNREMESRAKAAGLSLSSYNASVYTSGKHPETPDPQTLEALAYVLRVPLDEVRELADLGPAGEPFQPHRSADLLTPPQRTAVNEIIRLLADGNRKAGEQGERDTSPMNQAGDDADSVTEANRGRLEHGQQPVPNLAEERRRRDQGKGFGHRDQGDLDHENTGTLRPPPSREDAAAYDAPNRGAEAKKKQDEDAEQQDGDR